MVSVEYSEAITETLDILKHTKKEDVDKISTKFMDYLRANASKTYKPELDHSKKIKDMKLKKKTKAILAIIYRNFWCNEEQKKEFDIILNNNEIEYQKVLKEMYNPDSLFEKRIKSMEEKKTDEVVMMEYKESIFKRFMNKIKNIFKIK